MTSSTPISTALRQIESRADQDDTPTAELLLDLANRVHESCEALEPSDPASDWLTDLRDALVWHLLRAFPPADSDRLPVYDRSRSASHP